MNLFILWVLAIIVGSFITGFTKVILGVEITSKTKYGEHVYGVIDKVVTILIGYILLSAIYGHFIH